MKKFATLMLSTALVVGTLAGCGSKQEESTGDAVVNSTEVESTQASAADMTEGVKTGFSVTTSTGKSKDAAEEDGTVQVDSLAVAVLVDTDGTILACDIDAAQTKINFSAQGTLTTDINAEVKSKNELSDEYGMKANSSIGKEWNEQALAFADYVVGKTIDEVKTIAVSEEGQAADEDLLSSVTVRIGDFITGVENAVTNATVLGASAEDTLSLGIQTELTKSKDATSEEDGVAQAYSTYSVVTTDASGVITSCYIDSTQGQANFDATGKLTSDLTAAVSSKQELKDEYGMIKASSIGKEWYEQANAFSAYVTGKTVDEVSSIAVTAEGSAEDVDLVSSVTVGVGPFITVVEKAVANAK